ncbi:Ig-like domain repeat protein [Methanosphaera stadtmanae]|uniref:Ig-like domain repeat protein n=1 Tax=Methanosphaera stadtmanae TaxID=2317 RepID=UPI0026DB724C|nr:Ig-like domain repeat protein [Methanosphaera stadtmanae]
MKTINKFLLATIVLLMVGLGCAAAADSSSNSTIATVHETSSLSGDIQSSSIEPTLTKDIQTTNKDNIKEKTSDSSTKSIQTKDTQKKTTSNSFSKDVTNKNTQVSKNVEKDTKIIETTKKESNTQPTKTVKKATVTTITPDDYDLYFRYNPKTNKTESTTLVSAGDVLDLQGTFKNVNFTIDKSKITITSIGKTAKLYNCTVNVLGLQSAGSSVHNLTITNNNYYGSGIYLNVTKNILVANNTIHVWGPFAFALPCDRVNNSLVIDNYLETSCREDTNRTHTATPWGLSYYNNIVNNTVVSDQANGIYFSLWGSGLFQGGYCDYNNVTGNDVTGGDTSWSYTIQIMGTGNIISYNNVRGGYRGISTQDFTNNTIIFNEVNGTAQGIFACEGAIVANNTVHVNGTTTGVEVGGDGAIIENNTITSNSGSALVISASNINIKNNYLWSTLGYGIYSKGKYINLNISDNTIISGKIGILFRKQSSSKKINYVNVTKNVIKSDGEYAIDFSEAGARNEVDVHIFVSESNVLTSKAGTGLEKAYLPPSVGGGDDLPDSNKTYTVTDSTYYTYFTDEQSINTKKVLKNDTIILKGEFKNKNFTFTQKTHVIGDNCIIRNGTITFTGDASASTLKNVKIINYDKNSLNRHGVEVIDVNNVVINNVNINNYDPWESFGIFICSSNGNTLTNNVIYTSGDYVNYGIFVYASDLNNLSKNRVTLNQSSKPIEYADEIMFNDRIGLIKEVLHNYGIILMYSSYNTVDQNIVNGTSQFKTYQFPVEECKNSIVGIDVYYDSNYNTITRNNVTINSYGPYEYGMGVLGAPWGTAISTLNATNNTFAHNNVRVNGGYFATGFIAGLNSINTTIYNNTFDVHALHNSTQKGDYTYGLTLESCTNTTFINNTINASAASLYTVELFGTKKNIITNNYFYGEATNPYGIAGYQSSDNTITNNTIIMRQFNYGPTSSALHADVIPYGKEGIMLMKDSYRNKIMYNTINTNATEYAVKLTEQAINTTVKENSIISSKYHGDDAVSNGHKTNIVSNNFKYFTNITAYPSTGTVGYPITIKAKVTSTTSDVSNLTVTFRIGLTQLGSAKVNNGIAQITVNSTSFLKPTIYTLIATVGGTNFQNATSTSQLSLNKTMSSSTVTVSKVNGLIGSKVNMDVDVTDSNGAKLEGNVTFKLENTVLSTMKLTLGRATYTYTIPANAKSGVYTITVLYSGDENHNAGVGTNTLGIQTKTIATVSSVNGKIGNPTKFTAKLTSNGVPLTNGKVTFLVDNVVAGTSNINKGVATYNYVVPTNFTAKNYTITVKYDGNDTLTSASASNKLVVTKSISKITYTPVAVVVSDDVVLTVKVTNRTNGLVAKSGRVSIKLNNNYLKYSNGSIIYGNVNKEGNAIFTFTAPAQYSGLNNITFYYEGNDQFLASSQKYTNGFIVRNPSKITVRESAGKIGNTATLKAIVTDDRNMGIAKGQVTFKINNQVIKTVNINKGIATIKYNIPTTFKAGTYKISAVYNFNKISIQNTSKLTVQKVISKISYTPTTQVVGDKAILKIKVTNRTNGFTAKNGNISIMINKETLRNSDNSVKIAKVGADGYATYVFTIPKKFIGVNNITIKYSGDDQFLASQTTIKNGFIVRNPSKVVVRNAVGKVGSTVTLNATVIDDKKIVILKGQVTFKVNNQIVKTVNITNGTATTPYTIPKTFNRGNYTINAVYTLNSIKLENNGTLTVKT